jgi:hypothetical protein
MLASRDLEDNYMFLLSTAIAAVAHIVSAAQTLFSNKR